MRTFVSAVVCLWVSSALGVEMSHAQAVAYIEREKAATKEFLENFEKGKAAAKELIEKNHRDGKFDDARYGRELKAYDRFWGNMEVRRGEIERHTRRCRASIVRIGELEVGQIGMMGADLAHVVAGESSVVVHKETSKADEIELIVVGLDTSPKDQKLKDRVIVRGSTSEELQPKAENLVYESLFVIEGIEKKSTRGGAMYRMITVRKLSEDESRNIERLQREIDKEMEEEMKDAKK